MSKSLRELLASACFVLFVWGAALSDTLVVRATLQNNDASLGVPVWARVLITILQLGIMYAGIIAVRYIIGFPRREPQLKNTTAVATILAWLSLDKIFSLPQTIVALMPGIGMGGSGVVAYITVFGSHLLATYALMLLISRVLVPLCAGSREGLTEK